MFRYKKEKKKPTNVLFLANTGGGSGLQQCHEYEKRMLSVAVLVLLSRPHTMTVLYLEKTAGKR